jgi:hypothetical protein
MEMLELRHLLATVRELSPSELGAVMGVCLGRLDDWPFKNIGPADFLRSLADQIENDPELRATLEER